MLLPQPLQTATLIKRYKRFLADLQLPGGEVITAHCPNTGSMKNCQYPGSKVWYTDSHSSTRKYPCTWQLIEIPDGSIVGVNTGLANSLVAEAIQEGLVPSMRAYDGIKAEVKYGNQNSRIDLLLQHSSQKLPPCFVEIKNVSLGESGLGRFPDAVTTRGQKHLEELTEVVAGGARAALVFCVQHSGVERVEPADDIDPRYGELLRVAAARGVEIIALGAEYDIEASSIRLSRKLPVDL